MNIISEFYNNKLKYIITQFYIGLIVFLFYTFIFGLRKSFSIGKYDSFLLWGMDFKVLMVVFQMFGYMAAKFFGIKFISELQKIKRFRYILIIVLISWLSWLAFAIVPPYLKLLFLFTNGFPLGLMWGLVFSYIEGRKSTDFIASCLAVSFIFGSGFVKSVGSFLLNNFNINEWWIPFFTGLCFIIPILLILFKLEKIPPPNQFDESVRIKRVPLIKSERLKLFSTYWLAIILWTVIYLIATIWRDIRDNFAPEIWQDLGQSNPGIMFTQTETIISILILIVVACLVFIKNNFLAFNICFVFILIGFLTCFGSTLAIHNHLISPTQWMILIGLGLYLIYIPFNSIFFERFISSFKIVGNVGFLIYVADSVGYVGSISTMVIKSFFKTNMNWFHFLSWQMQYFSLVGIIFTIACFYYLYKKRTLIG